MSDFESLLGAKVAGIFQGEIKMGKVPARRCFSSMFKWTPITDVESIRGWVESPNFPIIFILAESEIDLNRQKGGSLKTKQQESGKKN